MQTIAESVAVDLGGWDAVSGAKRLLIERVAFKVLCCRLIEAAAIKTGAPATELDVKNYGVLANSLQRDLVALGLESVPPPAPELGDYLRARSVTPPQDAQEATADTDADTDEEEPQLEENNATATPEAPTEAAGTTASSPT